VRTIVGACHEVDILSYILGLYCGGLMWRDASAYLAKGAAGGIAFGAVGITN